MSMSPFLKGVIGFLGCAGLCTAVYSVGKAVGREQALRDIELEECHAQKEKNTVSVVTSDDPKTTVLVPIDSDISQPKETAVERVRKMKGFKNTLFGGTSVVKELLKNPDNKKLTVTVENGEIVARIAQK